MKIMFHVPFLWVEGVIYISASKEQLLHIQWSLIVPQPMSGLKKVSIGWDLDFLCRSPRYLFEFSFQTSMCMEESEVFQCKSHFGCTIPLRVSNNGYSDP